MPYTVIYADYDSVNECVTQEEFLVEDFTELAHYLDEKDLGVWDVLVFPVPPLPLTVYQNEVVAELKRLDAERKSQSAEWAEVQERALYEKLKAKYEGGQEKASD